MDPGASGSPRSLVLTSPSGSGGLGARGVTLPLEVDRPHEIHFVELVGGPGLRAGVFLRRQQRGEVDPRRGQAVALQDALDGASTGQQMCAADTPRIARPGAPVGFVVEIVGPVLSPDPLSGRRPCPHRSRCPQGGAKAIVPARPRTSGPIASLYSRGDDEMATESPEMSFLGHPA